jgi:L-threonylcarbamoyladenylate synthase
MENNEDIAQALKVLRDGGVILYPTDTIWGLGCDPTNDDAVRRIFSIKSRTDSKSLIILVSSESMLERYVKDVPEAARNIIEVSDKPITIIYPGAKNLSQSVVSADGSVGIRICQDEFCRSLIERFRKPIVSTSANISGETFPENFTQINKKIIESVDYVVHHKRDYRQKKSPSPVIKIESNGTIKIIRS